MSTQKIAVIGIGGVGGYIGFKLSQYAIKYSQNEVYLIARDDHYNALVQNGLQISVINKFYTVTNFKLVEKIADLPLLDIVFICTKSYDLNNICYQLKNKITSNTIVIPLLNGFTISNIIRKHLPQAIVLDACIYINSYIEKPGVIIVESKEGFIIAGYDHNECCFSNQALVQQMQAAGLKFQWSNDIRSEIWKKYIFVETFALITSAHQVTIVESLKSDDLRQECRQVIIELIMVAKKLNIYIQEDYIDKVFSIAEKLQPHVKTSFHRDIEKNKAIEKDIFLDDILTLANSLETKIDTVKKLINRIKKLYLIKN